MSEEDSAVKRWFRDHTDGRQKCSICDRCIPKYIKRVSFSYTGSYGNSGSIRICEKCVLELSEEINHANVDKWRMEIFMEEL